MTDKIKRLRVAHAIVQPVLVYDDGEELTPGPAMNRVQVPLSALADLADEIRERVSEGPDGQGGGERDNG